MTETAWLFPGQASQIVGMGKDLYENTKIGYEYFNIANEIMKCDIKNIIFNGPDEELRKTQFTQPSIYIVSVILGEILLEKGLNPHAVAGHSLGEYSALTIAKSLNFKTGLELVKVRSQSMADAGKEEKGTMAAIVGLDDEVIFKICNDYRGHEKVVPANYNSPGQVVISGHDKAVEWAMNMAKERGARMCVRLNVSGAFHSSLMQPAREKLSEVINKSAILDAAYPVYTNINATPVIKSTNIKNSLIQQLEKPVLWSKTIKNIEDLGITSFYEVGPGTVLKGLNKRINRKLSTICYGTFKELENINV